MLAGLVGERRFPDVGLALVGDDVGLFRHEACKGGELRQVETHPRAVCQLQAQGGDEGAEVQVAAALSPPVDGALHVHGAAVEGRQGVGNGVAGVVMEMHAQGAEVLQRELADNAGHLGGQGAPVGVAEDQAVGAGLVRRLQTSSRA